MIEHPAMPQIHLPRNRFSNESLLLATEGIMGAGADMAFRSMHNWLSAECKEHEHSKEPRELIGVVNGRRVSTGPFVPIVTRYDCDECRYSIRKAAGLQ